jgi:hypothetical protein
MWSRNRRCNQVLARMLSGLYTYDSVKQAKAGIARYIAIEKLEMPPTPV